MNEIINEIDDHFQFIERFPTVWILTKLICVNFFVAHLFGCGFHGIGIWSGNEKNSWLV
jgi:hypothetical protein